MALISPSGAEGSREWKSYIQQRIDDLPQNAKECQRNLLLNPLLDTRDKVRAVIVDLSEKFIVIVEELPTNNKIPVNLPGGKIKEGESVYQALYREVCEEVGLELSLDLIDSFYVDKMANRKNTTFFYIKLAFDAIDVDLITGPELFKCYWYPIEELFRGINENRNSIVHYSNNLLAAIDLFFRHDVDIKTLQERNRRERKVTVAQLNEDLVIAAKNGDIKEAKRLIYAGAYQLYRALSTAIHHDQYDMTVYLLDQIINGPIMEGKEIDLNPSLAVAADMGNFPIVKALVEAGATDLDGALWRAARGKARPNTEPKRHDYRQIVRYLIDQGATGIDDALRNARQKGDRELISYLTRIQSGLERAS